MGCTGQKVVHLPKILILLYIKEMPLAKSRDIITKMGFVSLFMRDNKGTYYKYENWWGGLCFSGGSWTGGRGYEL
jgi:hypothetical protein